MLYGYRKIVSVKNGDSLEGTISPFHAQGREGNYTRPLFAAIPEPLGMSGCALATFPKYELATRRRFQTISGTYQKSNMAAGEPEIL